MRLPHSPLVIVNEHDFGDNLLIAVKNLQKDRLFEFMETFNPTDEVIPIQNQPRSDILQIVQKIPVQLQALLLLIFTKEKLTSK